jgi:hypothetical protein
MKIITKITIASTCALIAMGATMAFASSELLPGCEQPVAGTPVLSDKEISVRLGTLGYTNIEEIEREGGCYEVEARTSDNREMELVVNAVTGEILKVEADD